MFGFNKKKQRANIRHRKKDEEDKREPSPVAPANSKPKERAPKAPKEPKETKPTKLSFDDDINTESDFKVKKSSISRKLAREREREKSKKIKDKPEDEPANLQYGDIKIYSTETKQREGSQDIEQDEMEIEEDEYEDPHRFKKKGDNPSYIPDAYAIHNARKKREQARKNQEYIPVKNDKVYKQEKSRLVREDDDSDDDRLDMKVHTEEDNQESLQMSEEEEEKDEELMRWENEQMKKGVGFGTGAPDLTSVDPINEVVQEKCAVDDYIPKFVMPDISIAAIENEIIGEINSLKLVLSENEMDLKSTVDALEASEVNIAKYETKTVELSSGFTFYQQTKGYINDYSHLLSLKIEAIEQVEVDIYTLFGKKCNDARDARRLLQQKLSVQLGIIKSQDMKYTLAPVDIPTHPPESDEEVEPEFVTTYNDIVDRSEMVMSEVRNEFSEITFVKEQFEKWKLQQSESYRNAYITQCLPHVFSPLIRLEMLGWNPLQRSCPNFEEYRWFLSLMTYGFQEGQDPSVDDPDNNLIPIIIAKVLVPKITRLVQRCWDPFSTKQTERLVKLVGLLFEDYIPPDTQHKELGQLLAAIQHEIEQLIIHEAYLPFTAQRTSNPEHKTEKFLSFQFLKCIKILKNILLWNNALPIETVYQLSIDSLLNRHLVAFLQTSHYLDVIDKLDMIIKLLPTSWFDRTDKLLPQLSSFATYLASLVTTLERKQSECSTDTDRRRHKTVLRKVMSMLLRINGMGLVRDKR